MKSEFNLGCFTSLASFICTFISIEISMVEGSAFLKICDADLDMRPGVVILPFAHVNKGLTLQGDKVRDPRIFALRPL
jgi:hypothetical protein